MKFTVNLFNSYVNRTYRLIIVFILCSYIKELKTNFTSDAKLFDVKTPQTTNINQFGNNLNNISNKTINYETQCKQIPKQRFSEPNHNKVQIIELNTSHAFRVIVNRINGDIIVGARNVIYRYNGNTLHKIDELITDPEYDSIHCLPPDEQCDTNRTLVNNDYKILLINYENENNYEQLLACGDTYQGMCYSFNATNFSNHHLFDDQSDFIENVQSFAFFGPSDTLKEVLYLANGYNGRIQILRPPSIIMRTVDSDGSNDANYTDILLYNYVLMFDIRYIYGFLYESVVYFIAIQQNAAYGYVENSDIVTKLIAVYYYSHPLFNRYVEIPLECADKSNNITYKFAKTAYFGKYVTNGIIENALFVALSVSEHESTINKTIGSALCVFTAKQISNAFTHTMSDCDDGRRGAQCIENSYNGHTKPCSESFFCKFIESNSALNGYLLQIIEGSVTSFAVGIENKQSVVVYGTNDGKIVKDILVGHKFYDKPIFEMTVSDSIQPNPVFDNSGNFLYLVSDRKLIKLPFGTCSLHTDFDSCQNYINPLKCVWCKNYCATKTECDSTQKNIVEHQCPPKIIDFTPKCGPISGGTNVTFRGENIVKEYNRNYMSITISGAKCSIIDWEEEYFNCITSSVDRDSSGFVSIIMITHLKNKRTLQTLEEFNYLEPILFGIFPPFGPYFGGTRVTLIGSNLNIGSKRTVFLAGINCNEIENNSTHLVCISGRYDSHLYNDSVTKDYSIQLNVDACVLIVNNYTDFENSVQIYDNEWFEYYEYKPNPVVFRIEPKYTIISGYTNITVIGNHLNSVKFLKMIVTLIPNEFMDEIYLTSNCVVVNTGGNITCLTPSLIDYVTTHDMTRPVKAHIDFIMDEVNTLEINENISLYYYPDPVFFPFNESDRIRSVNEKERILELRGNYLTSDYSVNILIDDTFGCKSQKILNQNYDKFYCEIENNINIRLDQNYSVEVRVGKLHFKPGYIKIIRKTPVSRVPQNNTMIYLMIALIVFIIISIAIGLIFYIRIYTKHSNNYNYSEININSPFKTFSHTYRDPNSSLPLTPTDETFIVSDHPNNCETLKLLQEKRLLIETDNISLVHEIGVGQYGSVYKGLLHSDEQNQREVAVKTIKNTSQSVDDINLFLREALIMSEFKHQNVLSLIGVCFEPNNKPQIILPLMRNGDLLSYIRSERNYPTIKDLITFAIDIAKGMEYLAQQHYVHRDLAARNCMLDRELCAKIADFGLSRDVYEMSYYKCDHKKCKLPVKWMSPESLESSIYNQKSDVWSYGVVVWELLTRGVTPYPDVDNWDVLNYLKRGRRMSRPEYCPQLLYKILLKCWSHEPNKRPTFKDLVMEVHNVINQMEKRGNKLKIKPSVTYVNHPLTTNNKRSIKGVAYQNSDILL